MKKDEKKDYETRKISALENTFGNVKYSFFKNNEILEIKIKSIKTEKMKTNKNITKVVTEVESTSRNGAKAVSSYTFYTLKKGIKDYIISPGMGIQLYF